LIVKVSKELDPLPYLISKLKKSPEVGSISIFIGVVRGKGEGGERVIKLEYDHHPYLARKVLERIVKEAIEEYGLIDAIAEHRVGEVKAGEEALYVLVASKHREEGFKALKRIVEGIKSKVPIWKKEVTDKGCRWVRGKLRGGHS